MVTKTENPGGLFMKKMEGDIIFFFKSLCLNFTYMLLKINYATTSLPQP